ncbi:MAG: prolyl-tRNA synthetase associated domain-containing protein [Bacteroides sp.]|nr:prolyl-tRNA synthetase associated domain-containing protein [Bacteroides sp.]
MDNNKTFYTSEVMTGAPAVFKTDTQRLIYESLDRAGIDYTRIESDPGISMDDCLNIDRAFGIDTVKTILLTNRQKNKFWLYVTHARKPFITKEFGASLQIPRVSFADEELMLAILGTAHGAATPFGLLRDEASEVTFVMDRDVAARDKIVLTDGDPCGFIAISNADLFRLLGKSPVLIENPAEIIMP